MKPFHHTLLTASTTLLVIVACGNSADQGGKDSTGKTQDLSKNTLFIDSLKLRQTAKFDFENADPGSLPPGWSQFFSGSGGTSWKITNDNGNKVLAQMYSDNPGNHFNIVVNDTITAMNMVLTVRLKGVSGKHDQGGGFVWRFTDKDNYYIVRANPLEDNVVLYKVQNGIRTDLPLIDKGKTYGVSVSKLGNGWNSMKLVVKNDLFSVFLNDKEIFKVQDNTFEGAGKVGLWSKADAVTYFDDFEILTY